MLTFQQMYEEGQEQAQDDSAASLVIIKRGINQGMQKFGSILNREWRIQKRYFSTAADSRYYQLPEDCIRPQSIIITVGGIDYPLTQIDDDEEWNRLCSLGDTSDMPEFYYVEGSDQFGIWPTPASTGDLNGTIRYEGRMRRMSQADYTAGTITVTAGSQNVVGVGTTWTAQMVGRTLIVEDGGDQDGIGIKVAAFTDATHITLENFYGGQTGGSKSYRIGEVPDIPDEFHESLIDYGMYRYYKRRKDRGMYADAKAGFDEAIVQCRDAYSSTSSSQYIPPARRRAPISGYVHGNRNLSVQ